MDEKMKPISDVIDIAINKYLWDGIWKPSMGACVAHQPECSCNAIDFATDCDDANTKKIWDFMRSLGVSTESTSEFIEFGCDEKHQYARAIWLTWAAMIAREQGL